ncbi:ribokinase [Paenibacillus sp. HN-1]|uniref:ribokinase n=1 Tax=Paenibacillus TaxID=44249 RepID=UPI001CA8C136|nr:MULTISPECIES: ribokinase [Paenibacillus]MBY9078558.1 ribokinase [Paenibacillus sp. CGMCC 1.18879]MBY9082702.1 ribokinase [Paenibacillus sinensis]
MGILVIGSLNMDMVVRTDRAPQAGETLMGRSFTLSPGGKGANQAVAAARLGGDVTMAGTVGDDAFGRELRGIMEQEGIHTQYLRTSTSLPTGVASIVVEESGENRILIVPGANLELSAGDLEGMEELITVADLVVLQLESDYNMTVKAAVLAHKHGVPVILNPAPAQEIGQEILPYITYLTPNETEVALMAGVPVQNPEEAEKAARILLGRGARHVIVTLGSKGALVVTEEGAEIIAGYPAKVVDTVAAGDSFNGALAVQLAKGVTLREAVGFANAVGALTVGREGAIPSLPDREETERFLRERAKV